MYQHISTEPLDPISLSFNDVKYSVTSKSQDKIILDKLNGFVPAGSFLAIMGSSGAGKSSLLDVLAGRRKSGNVQGSILFNGAPRPQNFSSLSAYVMQDDALIGNLTVEETLNYSLRLRVPAKEANQEQRNLRIDALLADLNLTKVRKSRVGTPLNRGISGGERKRLSIAVEMVTGPQIVFLDEPTTGLDSHNALRVMRSLKNLCSKHNVTVICTVHQPRSNIFHLFDNIMLLDTGRTVYYGSDPVSYFRRLGMSCPQYMNPADFLLDIILQGQDEEPVTDDGLGEDNSLLSMTSFDSLPVFNSPARGDDPDEEVVSTMSVEQLVKVFRESDEQRRLLDSIREDGTHPEMTNDLASVNFETLEFTAERIPQVSKFTQVRVLLSRTWRQLTRDSNVVYVRTFAALFIAILVGTIYFQLPDDSSSDGNRLNSILFLMCVFSMFCLPSISKFIEDRLVFTREHASGFYSTLPYCLASFLCELPILLITVIVYSLISYWMVGFQPGLGPFIFFVAVVFFVIQVAYGACQVIAATVKTVNSAIALYVMFLLYSLLLGGFLIHIDALPTPWIVYSSYFYYGFAALVVNEFEQRSYGEHVLSELSLSDVNKYWNLGFLVIIWLGLKTAEYFCLRFIAREKR